MRTTIVQIAKKNGIIRNRKGASIISVVMVFVIMMILMTSIVYVARQDVLETVSQYERLQTFYIASAGIELTYAALMDPDYEPKKLQTAIDTLKGNGNTPLSDSLAIGDEGSADVTIKRVTVDEKDWLQITSVGQLAGKSIRVTTTLRINEDNPNQLVREKFGY